jgi:hypothetical protein
MAGLENGQFVLIDYDISRLGDVGRAAPFSFDCRGIVSADTGI